MENCITFGMRTQNSNKLIDNGTFGFGYNAKTWFGLDDKFGLDDITQFGLVWMIKDMIARITLGLLDPCFPALVAPRSVQPEIEQHHFQT